MFKTQKVKVVKYNHSLEKPVSNESCIDAFLQLSNDEFNIIITKKVLVAKDEYILEGDPNEINRKIK